MDVLEELAAACSTLGAAPAGPTDELDGAMPRYVARPATTDELAATLRSAAKAGLRVGVRAAGTKLDWGLPPAGLELVVDLAGMDRVLEHAEGDLVLRAQAGARLAAVQDRLRAARQWLPIDEVVAGSTLGGIVATGLSGPSRHAHGAVRDLLIGATVVRVDGTVARAGGKVVKNVAGYDLCKLFTGSYGTLVVLAELTFRLRPLPAERRALRLQVEGADLEATLRMIRRAPEEPSTVELVAPATDGPFELTVVLEGRAGAVDERAAALAGRLGGAHGIGEAPPPGFGALPGPLTVKVTAELGALCRLLHDLRAAAAGAGLDASVRALPGVGVVYAGLPADSPPDAVASLLAALRGRLQAGGTTTVLRGPSGLRRAIDCWGEVPGLELMRRVKDQFDPRALLAPGRFVGGI